MVFAAAPLASALVLLVPFSTSGAPSTWRPRRSLLRGKLADVTDPHFGATMVISTSYLPETTVNVRDQHVLARST